MGVLDKGITVVPLLFRKREMNKFLINRTISNLYIYVNLLREKTKKVETTSSVSILNFFFFFVIVDSGAV